MTSTTYTIWDLLREVRAEDNINHRDVKKILGRLRPGARDYEFCRAMERRTGVPFLVCEGSGVPMPGYTEAYMLEHGGGDGDFYCQSWVESFPYDVVYAHCEDDEGYALRSHCAWVDSEERWITDHLYEREYARCDGCREVFHSDDMRWQGDGDYCEGCYEAEAEVEDEDDGTIHSYGTDVLDKLNWTWQHADSEERLFGVELEMEFPGALPAEWAAYAIGNIAGLDRLAIWKSDGSLANGAELVTLPLPLREWQDRDNPVYRLCDDSIFRTKARSHDTSTCGLHVHVTRATIPEPVIAKLVVLFNDPSMAHLTLLIARRPQSSGYCVARKKKWVFSASCNKRQWNQDGRYTPVNIADNTIEFRLFKGTLRPETIMASVEFCQASIDYCTQQGAARMNGPDFQAWLVAQPRKAYPALREYLIHRKMLSSRRQRDNTTPVVVSEPIQI